MRFTLTERREICYTVVAVSSLREVAAHAGVSVATASRVASGASNVRPATRERVERAMRDLLYVPPAGPASSGAIGLLVPELANPIFPALAQAMEANATAVGLASILCNTAGSILREADYVRMLLERRVAGMIFISCEMADLGVDHSHYGRLADAGAQLVFVNGATEELEVPSVGVDERAAGQLATQHLLERGHRRIGFVAGPAHYLPTREKAAGREAALRSLGVAPDGLVAHDEFSVDGGRRAARVLLSRPSDERPTGLICSSDLMAIGALMEATALGLRVPDDLSVVGFDGIEAGEWTDPKLTTIEQPIAEIAATAVGALRMLIDEPERELPHYVFRPKLLARGSTGPAPA
jgi:DNA-binding LacI/PurR family transcriptional regulator